VPSAVQPSFSQRNSTALWIGDGEVLAD
jgi:hypothetical protein